MKKYLVASLLLLTASTSQGASVKYVNGDGSPFSQACITLLHGDSPRRLPSYIDLEALECNGQPARQFIEEHRSALELDQKVRYVFRPGDESLPTSLCHAAVTEPHRYEELKRRHFPLTLDKALERNVLCNGEPLRTFKRKYQQARS